MAIKHALNKGEKLKMRYIPVVDSKQNMNLMYQIKAQELMDYCELFYPDIVNGITEDKDLKDLPEFNNLTSFNPKHLKERLV